MIIRDNPQDQSVALVLQGGIVLDSQRDTGVSACGSDPSDVEFGKYMRPPDRPSRAYRLHRSSLGIGRSAKTFDPGDRDSIWIVIAEGILRDSDGIPRVRAFNRCPGAMTEDVMLVGYRVPLQRSSQPR